MSETAVLWLAVSVTQRRELSVKVVLCVGWPSPLLNFTIFGWGSPELGPGMAVVPAAEKIHKTTKDGVNMGVASLKWTGSVKRKVGLEQQGRVVAFEGGADTEEHEEDGFFRRSAPRPAMSSLLKWSHSRQTTPGIGTVYLPVLQVSVERTEGAPVSNLLVSLSWREGSETWDLTTGILAEPCVSIAAGKRQLAGTMFRVV
jgi:hypothetical protein